VDISWLGHSCFRLRGRDAALVTDPCPKSTGYNISRPSADIVTVSHEHEEHNFVKGVAGTPKVIRSPGEYEIAGVMITGLRTYHDSEHGTRQGKNTVYVIEMDNIRVCHLGDLGHVLSAEKVEEMSGVDILLAPVGGSGTLDAAAAAETVSLLAPRLVIPMHYATEASAAQLEPLDRFLKEMGVDPAISPQARLSVSRGSLPHETQVLVLDYKR
jgi:L-ascorbate metabolism protein UlaG (beta-lactamase superfamily)